MSYINKKRSIYWIEENHPENGWFRVYWTDSPGGADGTVVNSHEGGATLDPDEGGGLRYEIYYKDGLKHGVSKGWFTDGTIKRIMTWKNGKRDGLETVWHSNGDKEYEETWKDDIKINSHLWPQELYPNGSWSTYFHNGRKKEEGTYKDGEPITEKRWDTSGRAL